MCDVPFGRNIEFVTMSTSSLEQISIKDGYVSAIEDGIVTEPNEEKPAAGVTPTTYASERVARFIAS